MASKYIKIPGVNFEGGGGGSDSADILQQLSQAELNVLLNSSPNQLIDSFDNDSKGVKVNTAASLDALRLTASNLTGTYTREKIASAPVSKISGVMVASLQALAPKNTVISANVIKFTGDVTAFFPTTKSVLIAKKATSDGETVHKFLSDGDGNIAELVVAASSYNSGLDETSITITNPLSLDLDLDVASSNYNTNLRVIPFDWKVEAKALTAASLEQLKIYDAFADTRIGISGEASFQQILSTTGTVIHHDVTMSQNGQYAIARVIERVSGGDQWRFYGSASMGGSWTLLGSKTAHTSNLTEENSYLFSTMHKNHVVVANNGKWFSAYYQFNGANVDLKGVYGDLTISSFTDVVAQNAGSPGGTIGTVATGNILVTGNNDRGFVSADPIDLSMVSVVVKSEGGSPNIWTIHYSNGGATHFATTTAVTNSFSADTPWACQVTGTSGAHRVWVFYRNGDTNVYTYYLTEASENFQTYRSATGIVSSQTVVPSAAILNGIFYDNNQIVIASLSSANQFLAVISNAATGTPSMSAAFQVNLNFTIDQYLGTTSSTAGSESGANMRHFNNKGYLSGNRLLLAYDSVHPDAARRTFVSEFRDVTSLVGVHINQSSADTNTTLRNTSGRTAIAQTFTANTNRVRSVQLRLFQGGTISSGYSLTCSIQATTGGLPNGTVIATATNTYDPRNMSKSTSGQYVSFNFENLSLVNGTVYAFVFESAYPINGTNNISFLCNSTSVYAGGQHLNYDGAAWNTTGLDLQFAVNAEWIYDLSQETRHFNLEYGNSIWNQEATLAAIDANNVRMAHKRVAYTTDNQLAQSGHVWSSIITLGSGQFASTMTAPAQIGYSSSTYDKNLIFGVNWSNGSAWLDRTTGAIDTTRLVEDRSGWVHPYEGNANIDALDFVADASFEAGVCLDLNGSDERVYYTAYESANLNSAYPFCVEVEFKASSVAAGQKCIVTRYADSANFGWQMAICSNNPGDINFAIHNSAGTVIGRAMAVGGTIAANTYYVARVTYDGLGGAPKIFLSTTGPNGTFTEVTYNTTTPFSGVTSTTTQIRVGNIFAGSETNFFPGKIGYIKIAKGSSTFAYNGYKDQRSFCGLINTGAKVYAESKGGRISGADVNSSFDRFGVIDPNGLASSVVDSNDIVLQFQQTLAESGSDLQLKLSMARSSIRNISAAQGLNFRFSK